MSSSIPKNNPAAARRVVVIGLDGATFDLIKPWAAEGHLPTLKYLLQKGAHTSLQSTIPPMTAPAWTSFATGTNPGKHRLFDWIAREAAGYTFAPVTALDSQAPTIYSLLSQAGQRVCALNIPMTYPAVPVNGVMVSGIPAPTLDTNSVYPKTLLDEIRQQVGNYHLYPDPGQAYSDLGIDAFLTRLYECANLRIQTFDYLRQQDEYAFAMMVFNGTDTISHAMWKFMDQAHPLHNPTKFEKYGQAIRTYYQYIDTYLGRLVDSLDDNTLLMIMSDHGFGPFHKFIHVNNWLIQEQFMQIQKQPYSQLKKAAFYAGLSPMAVYDTLMKLGLGGLKKNVVRGSGQGLLKKLFLSFNDVDWPNTAAYSLGNVGQICLNVKGREPLGAVEPGRPYEQTRDQIIDRLWQLRDPDTHEQVVEAIYRREEIYKGDQVEHAPDILFLPRRLEYFGFGEYEFGSHQIIEPMKRGISGTHRMNGILMTYGADIQPGAAPESAALVDCAPTILYAMGLPVPEHMDGRVLYELFHPTFSPEPVDSFVGWDTEVADSQHHLSKEDAQILSNRLRDLGYVG